MHTTTGPSVVANFTQTGTFPITLEIKRSTVDNRVIALGKGTITVGGERWQLTSFQQTALTNTYPANHQGPTLATSREIAYTSNELRDSILARPGGAILELYVPNRARPQGFVRPGDLHVRASVSVSDTAMLLTFPRGGGTLVEAVAARGPASATIASPNLPFLYSNAFARLPGNPTEYRGVAANWVRPLHNAFGASCGGPPGYTGGPASSTPRSVIEFSATTTPTGITGTITFITQEAAVELQANPTVCLHEVMAGIYRTFTFTAVPAPAPLAPPRSRSRRADAE